jgi:hypothetical protein
MAKQVVEVLTDDLSGEVIPEGSGQTITLMVNDKSAQLDLSDEHARELEQVLAPYFAPRETPIQGAAPNGNGRRVTQLPTQQTSANKSNLSEIRKWAKANGYKVSERGRIPFAVMDAFTRTHMVTGATRR